MILLEKVLATQTWESEFNLQHLCKQTVAVVCIYNPNTGGQHKRIPGVAGQLQVLVPGTVSKKKLENKTRRH